MSNKLSKKIKVLLELGRYNNPVGAFLLMWPCFWGVLLNPRAESSYVEILILLFFGSFVMRGAGCCINDLFDKDFDKKVKRTKNRPLAKGIISNFDAVLFIFFQLSVGLMILINFNLKVIFFSLLVMPLVIIYPLFKRVTFFPQIFLGLIFNWGILVGFLIQNDELTLGAIYLYISGFFLTIAYDTIYAFQDLKDDKKIGVKSLAIYLEKKPRIIIFLIFFLSFFFLNLSIYVNTNKSLAIIFFLTCAILICYFFQYLFFLKKKSYKKIFDFSAFVGFLIAVIVFIQSYL